jgi:adenine phosphoribosyltransferase
VVVLFAITLYITLRFEWKMAVGAMVAMVHDVLITAGVYALTGREVSPPTVIAILTILGFSLYDTVVIFDKVKENTESTALLGKDTYEGVANYSMNQVLMRSVNTSLVVILPILSLLLFGGATLKDFAFAMLIGVVTGAYSSIFIATPILVVLKEREPRYQAAPCAPGDPWQERASPARGADQRSGGRRGGAGGRAGSGGRRPVDRGRGAGAGSHPRARVPRASDVRPPNDGGGDPLDLDQLKALVRDVPDFPQEGVLFKDITPLLADPLAFSTVIDLIVVHFGRGNVDKVVGIEARGFILASPVAYHFGAGFVPVRKVDKLPWETEAAEYELEYGTATLEIHRDAVAPGERVLIVDDVLATGGTSRATAELVERIGGKVIGISCLIELAFLHGREKLEGHDLYTLLRY